MRLIKSLVSMSRVEFTMYFIALLWSFSGVVIKVFVVDCNAFVIAGVRGGIAAAFELAYLRFIGENFRLPRSLAQWIAAIGFTANTILLVFAFQYTSVENAVFLHFSGMGLAAFGAARLLGEKIRWQDCLAIGGVLGGIGLLGINLNQEQLLGNCLGVLCGITLCIESIAFRYIARQERKERGANTSGSLNPTQSLILHTLITSDILTCLSSCLLVGVLQPRNINIGQNWLLLLFLGTIPWAIPNIMYCYVVREIPSLVKAMIAWSLEPVFTAVWAIIVTQIYPSRQGYLGCGIILIAVLYSRASERIAATSDSTSITSPHTARRRRTIPFIEGPDASPSRN